MADQEIVARLADGMHFEATGYPSEEGATIHLDSKPDVGGQGLGSRPQSLLLVSLAGCTGMDVISILRKKRQEVTDLEVRVSADRAEAHPRVYTHIWVKYVVTGKDVDPAAVERAIQLSMDRYCPVANQLKTVVPIDTSYEVLEG